MLISPTLKEILETAESKALATCGESGLNVVPVSMIRVNEDGTVWLFNFFMDKSVTNIKTDSRTSLVCWTKMKGVQLKADVEYIDHGEKFEEAVAWVKDQNPDRIVKGLLILSPTEAFDISPGGAFDTPLLLDK